MGIWHEFYDAMAATVHHYDRDVEMLNELFLRHGVRTVLDVGCGTGTHACSLARKGFACMGCDIDDMMVDRAREKAARDGLDVPFEVADGRDLQMDRRFDAVLCQNLPFPHGDLPRVLESVRNVLQRNGLLVMGFLIGSPEENSEYMDFDHVRIAESEYVRVNLFKADGQEYLWHQIYLRQGSAGSSFDLRTTRLPFFPSTEAVAALVSQNGFKRVQVRLSGQTDLRDLSGADMVAVKE